MNLNALFDRNAADAPIKQKLREARARCGELEAQIERLTNALLHDDGAVPITILRKTRELEATLELSKREVINAEAELASVTRKTPAAADEWEKLTAGVWAQDYDARLKARQLIADTFSRIVIYRKGSSPNEVNDKQLDIVLIPHGGQPRGLRIHRKTGEWIAGEDVIHVS